MIASCNTANKCASSIAAAAPTGDGDRSACGASVPVWLGRQPFAIVMAQFSKSKSQHHVAQRYSMFKPVQMPHARRPLSMPCSADVVSSNAAVTATAMLTPAKAASVAAA